MNNKKFLLWQAAKPVTWTSQAAEPSGPGFCHVEEFTYLSVAK